eukprot:EG_transcript_14532
MVLAWPSTHVVAGFLVVIAFALTSVIWQSGDRQLSIAPLPRLNGVLRSRLARHPHGPARGTPAPRNTAHRTKGTLPTTPWPPLTVGATSTPDVAQDGGFRAAPSEGGIEGAALRNVGRLVLFGCFIGYSLGSYWADLLAGVLGSTVCTLLLYPWETYRTRIQSGEAVIDKQGVCGLYNGFGYGILKDALPAAVYAAVFTALREAYLRRAGDAPTLLFLVDTLAGGLGTLAGSLFHVPFESVAKQIQVGVRPGQAFNYTFGAGNAPYQRLTWLAVMLRDVPCYAIEIAFFKALVVPHHVFGFAVADHLQRMLRGALASGLAALITTPFDVLATCVMTDVEAVDDGAPPPKPASAWGQMCAKAQRLYRAGGGAAFWRGTVERVTYFVPAGCIFFYVMETLQLALR